MSEKDKELISIMTEAVPQMVKTMILAPFTEDSAKQIAAATLIFYNELKKNRIPLKFAERLTETYLNAFRTQLGSPQLTYQR